jgi:alkanesulfonate monooxygenase SsuD/methylene tetrahydromethanopterin reductase-like flavin-dependent oxidoreductase (luciferase family)
VQPGGVPVWFGIAPTERNFARIAELGDGWIPMESDPEKLGPMVDDLRGAFRRAGRDPAKLEVRVVAPYVFRPDYSCDLDATLEKIPALVRAGATIVEFHPLYLAAGADDLGRVLDILVDAKGIA